MSSVLNKQQQQQQQQSHQGGGEEEPQLELPPGFRFHPTDEEVVSHYLTPKALNLLFTCLVIADVDLNKCEPWDLPGKAKMGEKEWYFFWHKGRKYPTGTRTNRATATGYWKATGRDKEIYQARGGGVGVLVGMKKTLVFYLGRAPRGEKTPWVMHEYRLEGKLPPNLPPAAKDQWAVCRVFNKDLAAKQPGAGGGAGQTTAAPSLPPAPADLQWSPGHPLFVGGFFDDPADLPALIDSPFPDDFVDYKELGVGASSSSCSGVKTEQQQPAAAQNPTTTAAPQQQDPYFFSMPAANNNSNNSSGRDGAQPSPAIRTTHGNPVAPALPIEDITSKPLYTDMDGLPLYYPDVFTDDTDYYSDMWKV